jgi:hypothetical protein
MYRARFAITFWKIPKSTDGATRAKTPPKSPVLIHLRLYSCIRNPGQLGGQLELAVPGYSRKNSTCICKNLQVRVEFFLKITAVCHTSTSGTAVLQYLYLYLYLYLNFDTSKIPHVKIRHVKITCTCTSTWPVLTHLYTGTVTRNVVIYRVSVWMPQAPSIWAMIRCGPGDEAAAPAKMAPRSPCPAATGSRPLASRFGRLRAWGSAGHFARPGGACDTCCRAVLLQYCLVSWKTAVEKFNQPKTQRLLNLVYYCFFLWTLTRVR